MTDEPKAATAIAAALASGPVMISPTRCWDCMYGDHPECWHSWAGPDDIEHAKATGQPDPGDQRCGCGCCPDRAPTWRAHCRICDWTIDSPVEEWTRIAGRDHRRRAHTPAKNTMVRYRWRGTANATQWRLLVLAAAGTLRCTSCDLWTPDEGPSVEWYAAGVSAIEQNWVRGLTAAWLLRVRPTWQRDGIYVPTPAGYTVLTTKGTP